MLGLEFFHHLVEPDAGRDGEGGDVVAALFRDEVGQTAVRVCIVLRDLLAEVVQARALGGAGLVGPHDEVVAVAIRGEKAVHGARGERAVGDELVEHRICIGENFARLLAVFFVVEDLRIHATQFPGVEKRRPVNERAQLGEREIFQDAHAGKLRLRRFAEVELRRLQPCFLDAHELCRAARVLLSE